MIYVVEEEDNILTVFDSPVEARQFCMENDIDVEDIQELSNGDSIQVSVTYIKYGRINDDFNKSA